MTIESENSLPDKKVAVVSVVEPEEKPEIKKYSPTKEMEWRREHPTALDLLGLKSYGYVDKVINGRRGFSFKVLKTFSKNIELPEARVGRLIGLNLKQLKRRRTRGWLNWKEADRLVAVANVLDITKQLEWKDVFTIDWLKTPNEKYFEGRSPLDVATTEMGRLRLNEVRSNIIMNIYEQKMKEDIAKNLTK